MTRDDFGLGDEVYFVNKFETQTNNWLWGSSNRKLFHAHSARGRRQKTRSTTVLDITS